MILGHFSNKKMKGIATQQIVNRINFNVRFSHSSAETSCKRPDIVRWKTALV